MKLASCFSACSRCGRADVMAGNICHLCRDKVFFAPPVGADPIAVVRWCTIVVLVVVLFALLREARRPPTPAPGFAPQFPREEHPGAIVPVCNTQRAAR